MDREQLYEAMMEQSGDVMEYVLERKTVEPGRSFSEEAMAALVDQMAVWVLTRTIRAWDMRDEPPTRLAVTVTASAS